MNTLIDIKKHLVNKINEIFDREVSSVSDLNYPPNEELGDISLPLFKLSQILEKTPNEIGSALLEGIGSDKMISSLKIVGPYLNFFLNKDNLIDKILTDIKKSGEKYGESKAEIKEKIVLEFSNVNTHKEYHVGHLRNICFGSAVTNILNACGHEALPISYINDFGIHVAKTLWNFKKFTEGLDLEKMNDGEKGYLLGKMYADACQKEKDDPTAKQMIGGIMAEIETRKGDYYELWEKTREWSIKYFDNVYEDLGVEFKDILYENEYVDRGREIIDHLLTQGILKISEGAIIADLENFNLNILVCVRSNNTSAYPVADLALAEAKMKKFKPDKSIYVVDNRQELYLKQIFKILELSGHKEKLIHLSHDFVKLPSGMMSSRTGNVITYPELKELVIEKTEEEIKKRHENWSEEQTRKTALIIGLGAIKFEMLKVSIKNTITFDLEKSLSFDGFTSSYIQYAYARIAGIFERNGSKEIIIDTFNPEHLKEKTEIEIIKKLAIYPEIVGLSGMNYDPSELAKYLYELAQLLNDYYHQVSIVNSEASVKNSRLSLMAGVAQTIKNGLNILGIKIINEM